jgi:hypothetical protein
MRPNSPAGLARRQGEFCLGNLVVAVVGLFILILLSRKLTRDRERQRLLLTPYKDEASILLASERRQQRESTQNTFHGRSLSPEVRRWHLNGYNCFPPNLLLTGEKN